MARSAIKQVVSVDLVMGALRNQRNDLLKIDAVRKAEYEASMDALNALIGDGGPARGSKLLETPKVSPAPATKNEAIFTESGARDDDAVVI
jgi:hypothetical protein